MFRAPVAAIAALLLAGACVRPPAASSPDSAGSRARSVQLFTVVRGEIAGVFQYEAEVRSKGVVPVVSRISARLERLYHDLGSIVRQGDALGELDRFGLEAEVAQLQAGLAAAETNLAVTKAGPRPEFVARAEAELSQARARFQALDAASRASSEDQVQASLEAARRRLADAEQARNEALVRIEGLVAGARARLEEALSGQQINRQALEQARDGLRAAEGQLAGGRQAVAPAELVAARAELARAEQRVVLSQALSGGGADLEVARAAVFAAERQLELAKLPLPEPQVRAAEAAVQHAFAALEAARERLRTTTLVAPIDGVVTEQHLRPGDMANPGMPVLGLMPPQIELLVEAREAHLPYLELGRQVTLSVDAYPSDTFVGQVRAIGPLLDPRTRTAPVKIEIADPRTKLRPGMLARLEIATPKRPDRLLLPSEAVVRSGSQSSVFMVVDGRARRQRIETGVTDGEHVEVLEGLAEDIQVIVNPPAGISDGDPVSAQPTATEDRGRKPDGQRS